MDISYDPKSRLYFDNTTGNPLTQEQVDGIDDYTLSLAVENSYFNSGGISGDKNEDILTGQSLPGEEQFYSQYEYETAMDNYFMQNSAAKDQAIADIGYLDLTWNGMKTQWYQMGGIQQGVGAMVMSATTYNPEIGHWYWASQNTFDEVFPVDPVFHSQDVQEGYTQHYGVDIRKMYSNMNLIGPNYGIDQTMEAIGQSQQTGYFPKRTREGGILDFKVEPGDPGYRKIKTQDIFSKLITAYTKDDKLKRDDTEFHSNKARYDWYKSIYDVYRGWRHQDGDGSIFEDTGRSGNVRELAIAKFNQVYGPALQYAYEQELKQNPNYKMPSIEEWSREDGTQTGHNKWKREVTELLYNHIIATDQRRVDALDAEFNFAAYTDGQLPEDANEDPYIAIAGGVQTNILGEGQGEGEAWDPTKHRTAEGPMGIGAVTPLAQEDWGNRSSGMFLYKSPSKKEREYQMKQWREDVVSGTMWQMGAGLYTEAREYYDAMMENDATVQQLLDWSSKKNYSWSELADARLATYEFGKSLPSQATTMSAYVAGGVTGYLTKSQKIGMTVSNTLAYLNTFTMEGGGAYKEVEQYFENPANREELTKMYGENYMDYKMLVASNISWDTALPNAVLEMLPVGHLASKWGLNGTIKKKLLRNSVRNAWWREAASTGGIILKNIAVQSVEESATEILQTLNELHQMEVLTGPISAEEKRKAIMMSGYAGFVGGGGMATLGGTVQGADKFYGMLNRQYRKNKYGEEIYDADYVEQKLENGEYVNKDLFDRTTINDGSSPELKKITITDRFGKSKDYYVNQNFDETQLKRMSLFRNPFTNRDTSIAEIEDDVSRDDGPEGEQINLFDSDEKDNIDGDPNDNQSTINNIVLPDLTGSVFENDMEFQGFTGYLMENLRRILRTGLSTIDGQNLADGDILKMFAGTEMAKLVASGKFKTKDIIAMAFAKYGAELLNQLDNETKHKFPIGGGTYMTAREFYESSIDSMIMQMPSVQGNPKKAAIVKNKLMRGETEIKFSKNKEPIATGGTEQIDLSVPITKEDLDEARDSGLINPDEYDNFNQDLEKQIAQEAADDLEADLLADDIDTAAALDVDAFMDLKITGAGSVYGNLEALAGTGIKRAQELVNIIKQKVGEKDRKAVVEAINEGRDLLNKHKPKKKKKTKKQKKKDRQKFNDSQSNQQVSDEMGDEAVDHTDEISFLGEDDAVTLEDLGLDDSDVQEVEISEDKTKIRFKNKGRPAEDKKAKIKKLQKKIKKAKADVGKLIIRFKNEPTKENEVNLKNALAVYIEVGETLAELQGINTKKTRFKKTKSKRKIKAKDKKEGEEVLPTLIQELIGGDLDLAKALMGEVLEVGGRMDFSKESISGYLSGLVALIPALTMITSDKSKSNKITIKDEDGGTHEVKIKSGELRQQLETIKNSGKKVQVIIMNSEGLEGYSGNLDEWAELMSLAYDVLEDGGYIVGWNSNLQVAAGTTNTPFILTTPEDVAETGLEVLRKIPKQQVEEAPAVDNTQPDNTAPETSNESLSAIMDDIVGDIIEVGKSYVTPPKTVDELKKMKDGELNDYLLSINGELEPGDTREEIIQKIRNLEGGGEVFSTMGVPPPANFKRFSAALDKLWIDVKRLGSALLEEFVKSVRVDINKKYKGQAKYELLVMLDKWFEDKKVLENPDALDDLGFNTRKRKEQARDWATDDENKTINTATEEDIIMDDVEGLSAFEELNPTDDTEINFEKNHAHTMVGRRFVQALQQTIKNERMKEIIIMARDYNGIATKEIADRYAWVKEGDNLNQQKFVLHFITHFQEEFPALKTIGANGKNSIKHMWIVNQIGNKMSFKVEQQFVVLNGTLQTRPEKLYNTTDPSTVVPSFIEADEEHGQYILDHVAIMRADNVFVKNKGFFFKDDETKIDGKFLRKSHIQLADKGWAIVGVKAGTTPSLVFVKISEEQYNKANNYEFYWKDQLDKGFIDEVDYNNYMQFEQEVKNNKDLPNTMLAQEIAIHELMQKMRWDKYAVEGGGAIGNFKRLKLDMSRGTKLTGFRKMKTIQFDYNKVVFSRGGKVVPHMGTGQLEGKYLFDGMLMSSGRFMIDFSKMFGFRVQEVKPVIRVRRPNGDYMCVKCHSQVPIEGLQIHEQNDNGSKGRLIATFDLTQINGQDTVVIRDAQGNEVDFVGSQDEFKNSSGNLSKLNTAHEITGDEIRILSLDKTSKTDAAFPKVWLDLLSAPGDKEIRNLLLKHLHNTLRDDFFADGGPASNIFKLFGDHKNEKYIQALLTQLTKMNDTLPNSVADYIRNLSAGYGHPVFLEELKEVVKNRIFVDYVLKGRIRGAGTMSSFSPNLGDDVAPGEVHMGIHNKWIKDLVEQQWRKVTGSTEPLTLDEANKFLQEFEISIMGVRQPINGKTGVKMLRVTKLLPSYRGNVSVLNQEDTFNIFTGDHDGDHIFFLGFPKELTEKLKEHMQSEQWISSHETANLDIFQQASTQLRISNIGERFAAIDGNVGALGSIENIISTKRSRGQLINKEIKPFQIGGTTFKLVDPSDEVIMDYAPLDENKLNLVPENKRVEIGGQWFLKTTSEHEIGILANAATDNPDRVLLAGWGYSPTWLISRVFKIIGPDGQEIFLDPETHKKEITILKWLLKEYKIFSTYEKGRNTKQKNMKLNELINVSVNVRDGQTNEARKVMKRINNKVRDIERKTRGQVKLPKLSNLELDESQKGIGQLLIGMIAHHERKFRRENKHLYIGNAGFMDKPESRIATANYMASRVVESKREQFSKMYNLTTEDKKKGYLFLRKFLYGKGAKFDPKLNKWTHKTDEDGNKIGGGFYTIFENLEQQHKNEEQHQQSSKMMLGGYTYNEGMDILMEEFFEEFKNLSEGAQAAFIYGFYTQAPVNWTMSNGVMVPASIVRASKLSKFLPAAFASVYKKDGTRDWTITDEWFSHWAINFGKGSAPQKASLMETQRFVPIDEITKC